jgi:hypothetical protein
MDKTTIISLSLSTHLTVLPFFGYFQTDYFGLFLNYQKDLIHTWSKCGRVLAVAYRIEGFHHDEYRVDFLDFNKLDEGAFARESFPVGEESWTKMEYSDDNRYILISTNNDYMILLGSYDAKQIGARLRVQTDNEGEEISTFRIVLRIILIQMFSIKSQSTNKSLNFR